MATSAGRRTRGLLAVVAVATLAAACGVKPGGNQTAAGGTTPPVAGRQADMNTTTTSTTIPASPGVKINGADGSEVDQIAGNAIADLQSWWATELPATYDGKSYRPVTGGFYSVDPQNGPLPPCATSVDDINGNAFYCSQKDVVAYDAKGLLPTLVKNFGPFSEAVVLAHEWGHAIQARVAFDATKTVTRELQADCFAGAWVRHVKDGGSTRFKVDTASLDRALAGFLYLRDEPGQDANDPHAHGSGFDRVSAFQDGYGGGATECRTYRDGSPKPLEFPFTAEDKQNNGGNLPYAQIVKLSFESLEDFWGQAYGQISNGKEWKPLAAAQGFTQADPPTCKGDPITGYALFYCVDDDYVGYDTATTFPKIYKDGGDFSVAALFGTQYGLAVEYRLGDVPDSVVTSTLRGDCYSGAWAKSLLPSDGNPSKLILSSGDLDEAIAALLLFRSDSDRTRQGPGFARVAAFRTGVLQGVSACKNGVGQ